MLPKPEILKGEVKESIDEVLYTFDSKNEISNRVAKNTLNYDRFISAIEFYSQPFQPEMITEYFEGWGKQTEFNTHFTRESEWVYANNNQQICNNDNCLWINGEPCINLPQTLSQFITNTIQANIKLVWKE